jgi:phytoene desaturase
LQQTEFEMVKPTVLVIGAGIGGIATAARLSRQGYQVTVVEKNEQPGGRCGGLVRDGHHFVTGASLFLMPELYASTFADLGERIEDHLVLRQVDPTYHIHFKDGTALALTSDLSMMQSQLEAIEPGSFDGFLRYLHEGYGHYELSLTHLVKRDFRCLWEFCTLRNLVLLFRLKALVKHYNNVDRYFRDPRLKVVFTFQDMYVGLSPYKAPSLFSLLQYTEFAEGVWFPEGGMCRVVEALAKIAQKSGVRFIYSAPVQKINIRNHRATGVTLEDGRQLQADIVVANADLPYVYSNLLPDDGMAKRLERKKYTSSAVMFFWGISKQIPQLDAHNIFMADDYRRSFESIFEKLGVPDDLSIYIHAPARLDPALAPEGQDTLMVVVPVGHLDGSISRDWTTIKRQIRQSVLQRLAEYGVCELEKYIKFELSYGPRDWQARFNLHKGVTHSLSHDLLQMGYFRPRCQHKKFRNLYFVGAGTHPGTGVPTVLVSARLAAERILGDTNTQAVTLKTRAIPAT